MEIKENKTYNFNLLCGELRFMFNIPGIDEQSAKDSLIQALTLALGQLKGHITIETY
jgi:hypothetical protein